MISLYTVKNLDSDMYLCAVPSHAPDMPHIWTNLVQRIKIYGTIGSARSAMTSIARVCYDNDLPKPSIALIQLDTTEVIINEDNRIAGAVQKIRKAKQRGAKQTLPNFIGALRIAAHRQRWKELTETHCVEPDVTPS